MFEGETFSGAHEKCFTGVGSGLPHKHRARLERFIRDKHTSMLQTFVNYNWKRFYNIGPFTLKHFTAVIYSVPYLVRQLLSLPVSCVLVQFFQARPYPTHIGESHKRLHLGRLQPFLPIIYFLEQTGIVKHSSLLWSRINNSCKK